MTDDPQSAERIATRFLWLETIALDKQTAGIPMRVAMILSTLINEQGYAWPGRETIAAIAGSDLKNVKDALKKLVALGYLRIEKNQRHGPTCVDRYWPAGYPDTSPVWARYREAAKKKGGSTRPPTDDLGEEAERGASAPARGVSGPDKGGAETPRLLEATPSTETPCSDPNGSAAACATASHTRKWKGSVGDPMPDGFPNSEAMQDASAWANSAGVHLNLGAEREAFRRHHFAVRCLMTDWPRSWEMWIEQAIERDAA